MNFTLPKKTVKLWRIRVTLAAVLVLLLFFYLFLSVSVYFLLGAAVALAVWGVGVFFYIPRLISSYAISITKKGVAVRYGVFFRTVQVCPETRFVFVQSNTTPLSKLMGLKSISFLAAKAKVHVAEADEKTVAEIMDFIKAANENE